MRARVLLLLIATQVIGDQQGCPADCICYQGFLSDLESWKWIETDVNVHKDDPLHEDFNPYMENNEVYDNPNLMKKREGEQRLETATCIVRSTNMKHPLEELSEATHILSIIQAPGTGTLRLEEAHFENLPNLVGLQIQGHGNETTEIDPFAFASLKNLKYLNLESVTLLENSIGPEEKKFHYEFVEEEQVIVIKKMPAQEKVVPYTLYKEEKESKLPPLMPNISVAFTGLQSLVQLRISLSSLPHISWDMFYKLDNLKFLLLEDNDLLFLPDFVFYATPNLAGLSLSRNRILNLQTVGLAGLLTLQKLDVSHNNITHLSELSLPPFPVLEVADFRHNPIQSIFPNTFEIMNSTKTLFLGSEGTPLELSANSFFGLVQLQKLDITNVKVDTLEGSLLTGMPNLVSLTMTGKIRRLMFDAFSEVPKLEKLVLRGCSIEKISMDAFFGLTSLIELDLSHNKLTFLPPGLFEQQVSLREVLLQHNYLETLPSSLFAKLPAKLIRLEGNPWFCNCDLKYWDSKITNKVKRYHVPDHCFTNKANALCEPKFEGRYVYEKRVSPICASPMKFQGKSVFEVIKKDLHFCENLLLRNVTILLTSPNSTKSLEIMSSGITNVNPVLMVKKVKKPRKPTTTTTEATTTTHLALAGPTTTAPPTTTESDSDDLSNSINILWGPPQPQPLVATDPSSPSTKAPAPTELSFLRNNSLSKKAMDYMRSKIAKRRKVPLSKVAQVP